jgi:hypothetical protein
MRILLIDSSMHSVKILCAFYVHFKKLLLNNSDLLLVDFSKIYMRLARVLISQVLCNFGVNFAVHIAKLGYIYTPLLNSFNRENSAFPTASTCTV